MNKKFKIAIITVLVLSLVFVASAVTVSTIYALKSDKKEIHNKIVETEVSHELDVNIQYYDAENDYNKVLDEAHVKKFVDKIENFTFYGPEIMGLREITINDDRIITSGEAGVYYPLTGQLGINTFDIEKQIDENFVDHPSFIYANKNNSESKYLPSVQNVIVELLAETFYHEYGHHIFSLYASNPFPLNKNYSNDLYIDISTGTIQNRVNKTFLNSFINIFKYDSKQKNPSEEDIELSLKGTTITPISKIYSLDDLYKNGNGRAKSITVPHTGVAFHVNNENHHLDNFPVAYKADTLRYLYSIEELFTRKFLLSAFSPDQFFIDIINGSAISTQNPLAFFGFTKLPTSLIFDMLKYDAPLDYFSLNKKISPVYNNKFGYFQDNPFHNKTNTNAKAFVENIAISKGEKQGYNLSYITHRNNLVVQNRYIKGDGTENDLKWLKFGGYIPSSSKDYKYIGYKDAQGQLMEISPIRIHDKNRSGKKFGTAYKEGLLFNIDHRTYVNDKNKWWTTNSYSDVSTYKGKTLYLYNNQQDSKKLTSYRGQSIGENKTVEEKMAGTATSFFEEDGYSNFKNGTIWFANKTADGVSIDMAGTYSGIKY